jgi:DNA polymerase
MTVIADFETANLHVSLPDVGAEVYAQDPNTEVLCLVMLYPNGLPFVWKLGDPWENIPTPDHVEAHNAFFEQMIWKHILTAKHGIPEPAKWSCSMAKALFKGLPGGLDKAATMIGLDVSKDKEGRALTLSLSKPMTKKLWAARRPEGVTVKDWAAQYTGEPDRSPETIARVVDYCLQDCIVEQALAEKVGDLSPYERRVYEFDNMVNHRGLRLDKEFIHQGMRVISAETDEMTEEFKRVTGGLEGGQIAKLRAWMAVQGIQADSLDKAAVEVLLRAGADLPDPVRRMLEIRQMLGSSSVTKLPRMVACTGRDGRSRGLLQYHGAGTGRWAGRLWQPHNLPARLGLKHTHEELLADIQRGDRFYLRFRYGNAIKAVASGIRYSIIPAEGEGG